MRSDMKSIMFAASAVFAMAVAVTPAAARGLSDVPRTAAKPATSVPAELANKKVCMQHPPLTGSRIDVRECRTVAEWQADGYTVTTKAEARAAGRR